MKGKSWFAVVGVILISAGCGNMAKVKEENATPVATVQGRVVDETLNPIQGATVKIYIKGRWYGEKGEYTTDEKGEFSIPNVPSADAEYRIVVEKDGYARIERTGMIELPSEYYPTENQVVDVGDIVLYEEKGTLKGCFTYAPPNTDVYQKAVSGAVFIYVYIPGAKPYIIQSTLDSNGCFNQNGLPSSFYGDVWAEVYVIYKEQLQDGTVIYYTYTRSSIDILPGIPIDLGTHTMEAECVYEGPPSLTDKPEIVSVSCKQGSDCDRALTLNNYNTTATKVAVIKITYDQIMDTGSSPYIYLKGPNVCGQKVENCDGCGGSDSCYIYFHWPDNEPYVTSATAAINIIAEKGLENMKYSIDGGRNYCGYVQKQYPPGDGTIGTIKQGGTF